VLPTDLGYINSWTQFWWSKAWNDVTQVANLITKQNLANEVSGLAASLAAKPNGWADGAFVALLASLVTAFTAVLCWESLWSRTKF
jgi:hypothetical protein